ncbi:NDR1/HIN1-like protein 10 [Tasmannia lanceolata]|uniref:NDR1/HIN1-like protein 10 n=1 Tax=Tasmannia lanceolata TaxID=3420 RepID=UPI004063855A
MAEGQKDGCLIAGSILIAVGLIVLLVLLILPFKLPDFSISSASVSLINASSSSQLTANWNLTFSVQNRNKMTGIYYDQINASVFYGSDFIAVTSLPPFHQDKHDLTTVQARLAANSMYLGDQVIADINAERSRDAVNFNFKLISWVQFRLIPRRGRKRLLSVFCDDVTIAYANATAFGTLFTTHPRQCQVDL